MQKITRRTLIITVALLIAGVVYARSVYFEYVGAKKNQFVMLRGEELRELGIRIRGYYNEHGRYPDSFEDLITAGRMSWAEVEFYRDGHRVVRTFNKPIDGDQEFRDVIVIESYDFLKDYVSTLAFDGQVVIRPVHK